ncbi:hypothetical protein [Acinetobacter johnsonii]|uniref:Uncharacterized protein n=1 Tax=Acinetobacter johnsonii TaxID=40214 RepID=A0A380UB15_ACIJO|nr:hypothetical protein [Acinetobacter johnsonii]ENU41209.1 hypothetical protein F986_00119 [Acinetobacter johnsonii CIP 64.6]QPS03359.1 hypothetical protein I6G67_14295 [Acinetobacter johnsonii]SUU00148.1 Uncharacterised protein [Acinetobacter johnsonii]
MTDLSGHSKLDVKIVALGIILSCGVVYAIYSTVRHFYVLNQVNEAKEMMSDIQSLLVWSMHQYHDDVVKACHFKNIQQVTQSAEFQNMNRILKLQDQIRQQTQFFERIKVNATPDLHSCITTTYFRKVPIVSEYLSGKYISYHYDFKTKKIKCLTNIQKRALVKACTRL